MLPDAVLAFETWGTLSAARDNAVYVAHALTGDAHAAGEARQGQRPVVVPSSPDSSAE